MPVSYTHLDVYKRQMIEYRKKLEKDFSFMSYAPMIFISAKTGQRIDRLFELIRHVANMNAMRISTCLLYTSYKLPLATNLAGLPRILLASFCSAVTKLFGTRGVLDVYKRQLYGIQILYRKRGAPMSRFYYAGPCNFRCYASGYAWV